MDTGVFCFGVLVGGLVVAAIAFAQRHRPVNLGQPVRVPMGRYIGGIAGVSGPKDHVECHIDDFAYVITSRHDQELLAIPRNAILNICCEEKSKLLPLLTATKNLSFSALGLDPAKKKSLTGYCLVFDWNDHGLRQNVIFEFKGLHPKTNAHRVMSALLRYRRAAGSVLRSEEKFCPSCAEVIKKSAIICRWCQSHVGTLANAS